VLQGSLALVRPFELRFFPQEFEERKCMLSGLGHEPRDSGQHSVECLDALFVVGCWKLSKCAAFVWVCFNSSFCKIETKEFTRLDSEGALFWVESHVVFPSLLEHSFEMGGMIHLLLGFYDHVVHVNL
jgi:hypothetical protein